MKKFAALLLAVLMILSLSACTSGKETVLTVSGTEINSEIFTYYLDKVIHRPTDYGLSDGPSDIQLKNAAIELCKRYLAANTHFRDNGLSLTAAEKVEISQDVNNHWIRFENHYNSIGISKQTITKILTSQAYEDAIFAAEYDKGTGNAEAEAVLQNYFYENYVSFRNMCAYFTSADGTTPMTQLEKNQLLATVNTLAANAGTDIEKFSEAVQAAGFTLSYSVILKKGAEGYPAGFYEKVYEQNDNTVQTLVYDECVFIVWKENLKEKGESVFVNYRSACINDLYADDAQDKTDEYIAALTVEENKRRIDRIYRMLSE